MRNSHINSVSPNNQLEVSYITLTRTRWELTNREI
jgi:hypothetical protein